MPHRDFPDPPESTATQFRPTIPHHNSATPFTVPAASSLADRRSPLYVDDEHGRQTPDVQSLGGLYAALTLGTRPAADGVSSHVQLDTLVQRAPARPGRSGGTGSQGSGPRGA